MRLRSIVTALAVLVLGVTPTLAQAPVGPVGPATPQVAPGTNAMAVPATPAATPALGKADVDTWLDGFMPYALASGGIAGAVVVVVKDGQVLTERGFGYADVKAGTPVDPKTTLFRPGSVSKLFTWTAVMQLVEAGKIDLDKDVNGYLDFTIPPYQGKPITMRALMTHTAGFEEQVKHNFVDTPARMEPLETFVKRNLPERIYAPRTTPAYSNYGAALAGYIVQRLSGEPFNDYIKHHIFDPLGMQHATFATPLPASIAAGMSQGYTEASQPPHPFEDIAVGPAGSLSATGDDMAKFVLAHLAGGGPILKDSRPMYVQQDQFDPPLPGMALGFYHEDRNGLRIVGHAGDTNYFHSDLHLLLDQHVGLFISVNSLGKDGAAGPLRDAFFRGFLDRYYPVPAPNLPTSPTAKADAKTVAGIYWLSRRSESSFFRSVFVLSQAKVVANPDGTITVSDLRDAARAPKPWREVAPFRWVDRTGSTLVAVVKDGKVVQMISDDLPPVMVLQPVPGWESASWSVPALQATVAILLILLLLWPLQALVRRRYKQSFALAGRRATFYRLTRVSALVQLLGFGAYFLIFALFTGGSVAADDGLDWLLILGKALCMLGILGALAQIWNAVLVWRTPPSSWWAKLSSVLVLLAGVGFAWFAITLKFANLTLQY